MDLEVSSNKYRVFYPIFSNLSLTSQLLASDSGIFPYMLHPNTTFLDIILCFLVSPLFSYSHSPIFVPNSLIHVHLSRCPIPASTFPRLAPIVVLLLTSPLPGTTRAHPLTSVSVPSVPLSAWVSPSDPPSWMPSSLLFLLLLKFLSQPSSGISRTSPMFPCSNPPPLSSSVPLSIVHFLTPTQGASGWAVPHGLSPGIYRPPLPVTLQREVSVAAEEKEGDRTLLQPLPVVEKKEFT